MIIMTRLIPTTIWLLLKMYLMRYSHKEWYENLLSQPPFFSSIVVEIKSELPNMRCYLMFGNFVYSFYSTMIY